MECGKKNRPLGRGRPSGVRQSPDKRTRTCRLSSSAASLDLAGRIATSRAIPTGRGRVERVRAAICAGTAGTFGRKSTEHVTANKRLERLLVKDQRLQLLRFTPLFRLHVISAVVRAD